MRIIHRLFVSLAVILIASPSEGQSQGIRSITRADLEKHMEFLASEELQGRSTGEPGLMIAARYLAIQAKYLGLKPADPTDGYFQFYTIEERSIDLDSSRIRIMDDNSVQSENSDPFYVFPVLEEDRLRIRGQVVFAGYGIRDEGNGYNDFKNIDIRDKVVLIMNRGPMDREGTRALFDNLKWTGIQNLQHKLPFILSQNPLAVLVVQDPKSGLNSIDEMNPGVAKYLSHSRNLKMEEGNPIGQLERPRILQIHRSVAEQLLEGTGPTLKDLQLEIDRDTTPRSFQIGNREIEIDLRMKLNEMVVPNVFGWIEGSDPEFRQEMVIYVAHFDHVGTDSKGGIFYGADDNASGTSALIELAEAFNSEKKKPARSIGILWVSAEEIGLFGSSYFADHPPVASDHISAVINLDMVGRSKTPQDVSTKRNPLTIVGGDTVKVIGGLQSTVLMEINEKTLEEMGMVGNYKYNDPHHPERYFYRSDHINFARKDIPVLFYSTGTHVDYHQVTDTEERIDYEKFLKMTRFAYKVGFNTANYPGPIIVDNPMSGW